MSHSDEDLGRAFYLEFAAALIRHRRPEWAERSEPEMIRRALAEGMRLHPFKRSSELPRVRKVLGILRGLAPSEVLDLGSGRGVFLWPLLDTFPSMPVMAVDRLPGHVDDYQAVHHGGVGRLSGLRMDVTAMSFPDSSFDVVTFLEVLEHLPQPSLALAEAVRVAKRFIVLSVPSKEDDNPEHIHLFDRRSLILLFESVGVRRLSFESVLNHLIVVAKVGT